MENYLITVAFSVLFNILMFIPAYIYKTDKLTDISYALSFIAVIIFSYLQSDQTNMQAIVTAMVIAWAIRLGGFLYIRITRMKRDRRFDGMREHFFKFLRFWLLQGITVPIVLLAASLLMEESKSAVTTVSFIGIFVFAVGLVIEAVADAQKFIFSGNASNKDKWIDTGIWRYSRHPNYLGEILVWTGVYVFCFPSLTSQSSLIAAISPLYIAVLLLFVSGIPLLEKSADKKWGGNKAYEAYKKRTPVLVPFTKY
jgi:steroid 5-alpha reductase family enzyme